MLLREKTISRDCFEASELNKIFYWWAHCDILDKSSLRNSDEELVKKILNKFTYPKNQLQVCYNAQTMKKSLMENFIFCAILSTSSSGISVILLLFINVFGLFSLFARYLWYFNLYSLGQNIWKLSYVLAQLPFTKSETELDYYRQRVNV